MFVLTELVVSRTQSAIVHLFLQETNYYYYYLPLGPGVGFFCLGGRVSLRVGTGVCLPLNISWTRSPPWILTPSGHPSWTHTPPSGYPFEFFNYKLYFHSIINY